MVDNESICLPGPLCPTIEEERSDILIRDLIDLSDAREPAVKIDDLPVSFYRVLRVAADKKRIVKELLGENFYIHLKKNRRAMLYLEPLIGIEPMTSPFVYTSISPQMGL